MKLETSIKPRKDGKVNVEISGEKYVFAADETGTLVCEVTNEANIGALLALGDFMPANEEDFAQADALAAQASDVGDEGEDEPDDEGDMNAAPVEEPASAVASVPKAKGGRPRKVA